MKSAFHSFTKSSVILSVIASLVFASGIQASEVVYSTDFEAPAFSSGQGFTQSSIDGWVGNNNGASILLQITDEVSHSGKQCLVESDQDTADVPSAWHRFQGKTLENAEVSCYVKMVAAETSFRIDFAGAEGVNFMVGHSFQPGMGSVGFWVKSGEAVVKATPDSAIAYNPTAWNKVTCNYNRSEKTFSIRVNDKEVLSLSKEEAAAVKLSADRIRIATGWVAGSDPALKAYFDDLLITTNL